MHAVLIVKYLEGLLGEESNGDWVTLTSREQHIHSGFQSELHAAPKIAPATWIIAVKFRVQAGGDSLPLRNQTQQSLPFDWTTKIH